jgi:peptide deformylase
MAKLVPQNHPALHEIATEVAFSDIGTPAIAKVLKDMRKALRTYEAEGFTGVAIAAPQIGVPLRIFIVEDMGEKHDEKNPLPNLVAINPKIIKISKRKRVVGEGCLSVPDHYGAIERSTQVTLRAYDETGNEYERGASGLLAQIFQHECDHLDGILFTDHAEKVWEKSEMHRHEVDKNMPVE